MNIHSFKDAVATAEGIINELIIPQTKADKFTLAVSGGSTPRQLFELMSGDTYRNQIEWSNLFLYWVDERCVPPTDEQSNYGMTAKALRLETLPLPKEQIFRIQGEDNPKEEAERYTALVEQNLPKAVNGLPQFDLIILGIGDDGHTSSIFPHQMHWLEERTPYVVAQHPSGQNRICLTGQTILAAKKLAFHAVGKAKATILQQIIDEAPEALAYPSAYFVRHRTDLALYTDSL